MISKKEQNFFEKKSVIILNKRFLVFVLYYVFKMILLYNQHLSDACQIWFNENNLLT